MYFLLPMSTLEILLQHSGWCGKPIFHRASQLQQAPHTATISNPGPLKCHSNITQGYTSNKPPDISPEPLQPATTTLTHENSQIHITTSQPQENSQQYTQPQLQHIHPQACLYFFLPFCSMHLCPLFHLHMHPHVGPFSPSMECSILPTVVPNHKLAFHSFYYKYCLVFPALLFPHQLTRNLEVLLSTGHSLIGKY